MNESRKKVKILDFALMVFCAALLLTFVYTAVHGQAKESVSEQRNLEKYPNFNFTSYVNGDFQNKVEGSLSDQFFYAEKIKTNTLDFKNKIYSIFTKKYYQNRAKKDALKSKDKKETTPDATKPPKPEFVYVDRYRKVSASYYVWGDDGKQLMRPRSGYLVPAYEGGHKQIIDALNTKVPSELDKYFFFVETPEVLDFNAEKNEHPIETQLKKLLPDFTVDSLKIENYDMYDLYFYDTDQHMNSIGARQAYTQIIAMILGKNEPLIQPTEFRDFGVNFYGSLARDNAYKEIRENFQAYIYDYPKHKTRFGETIADGYGGQKSYLAGKISRDEFVNHYRSFAGGDWPMVHFDYSPVADKRVKKKNVLVIADSMDNATTPLIATHFNNTYTVDLRHYENYDITAFCDEHDIDTFIYIGYISTITEGAWILK